MALVVLLRGVNVGGHRVFRPTELARKLRHLDPVNIGAAGTLVIRGRVREQELREQIAAMLPFDAEIMICEGQKIARLLARDVFAEEPSGPELVRFVSVLARVPRPAPSLPLQLPSEGEWLLKVSGRDGRFLWGHYRRHMKSIGYLGSLDRIFGVPLTTRNWNTLTAIGKALEGLAVRRV